MQLSIIIVNWKSVGYLRACLASVDTNARMLEYEVIVVDNDSGDGCGDMLAAEFPKVRFIQSGANLGFAKANNLGATQATGLVLCFLNPDTVIHGPALSTLYEFARDSSEAGAVGCRLLNTDGSVQTSCIQAFPTVLNQLLDAEGLRRIFPRSSLWGMAALFRGSSAPQPVEVISGACLVMRRAAFESVGGFSQDYFMYGEDLDLCFKVRLKGLKNFYVPQATVTHFGGGSSSQRVERTFQDVQMRESIRRFLEKFRGTGYAARYRISMAWAARIRLLLLRMSGSQGRVPMEKWRGILRWAMGAD